ncbi:MAG: hypothetical protein ACP5KG_13215, partial [Myxococcota bacterium]
CKRDGDDGYKTKKYDAIKDIIEKNGLFLSEIGSTSTEYSAYVPNWTKVEWRRSGGLIYGITNIRDYQEQVDMLEGDIMVFMNEGELRGNKKLRGIIIFSDDLIPEKNQLFWYNFPPTGKPSDKWIRLLSK